MRRFFAVVLLVLCAVSPVRAEEIAVAAASDLNFAIKEVIGEFEKQTGHRVKLSLGSSGNFYAQLQQGAPFDLYFSADIGYPKKLEEAGLTVPGSLYRYAVGRVVLWAPKNSPLDVNKGLTVLREATIKKIAIANPKHAPYGRAAVAALEHARFMRMSKTGWSWVKTFLRRRSSSNRVPAMWGSLPSRWRWHRP